MNHMDASSTQDAVRQLYEQSIAGGQLLHSIIVYQHGKELLRFAAAPYACTDKRELYSLSKSFTSTAVGVLFDQGLLNPEDNVLSFFPMYAGLCAQDKRWQRMLVRHLLSMSTGHATCVFPQMAFADDSVQAFFDAPLTYEPGEVFVYNSGATCLLAAIVERVAGVTVPVLLAQRVFPLLDIDDFTWKTCCDGKCQGGTGLSLSCDDLAKFGLMLLHQGVYNKRRVLSEEWVAMATSCQISNSDNGTADWCSGYGFQFWRNSVGGFRGDGAFGQACIVLPQRDMVVVLLSECDDMCYEFNLVWPFLANIAEQPAMPAAPFAYLPTAGQPLEQVDTGWRTLEQNPVNLRALRLRAKPDGALLFLLTDTGVQRISAPYGAWESNALVLKNLMPTLHHMIPRQTPQQLCFHAAAHQQSASWIIQARMYNAPHAFDFCLTLVDGLLSLTLRTKHDVFGAEKLLIEKRPNIAG